MTVFVDTTAFYALVDRDDGSHTAAVSGWRRIAEAADRAVTHHLVLVEAIALLQSRIGLEAVRDLLAFTDRTEIVWIAQDDHRIVLAALLASGRRPISYVDQMSFHVMRTHGIDRALAFDRHFEDEGFTSV